MSDHDAAGPGPYCVELEADKTYSWCRCGRGKTQPFCDGTHNRLTAGQASRG